MFCYRNGCRIWLVVQIFLWKFLTKPANSNEIYGSLPDKSLISRLLHDYVRPMLRTFPLDTPLFRSSPDIIVERAVNKRISELKQYLQDDDRNVFDENNFLLDGNDETAIVEFLPKANIKKENSQQENFFKNNLKKYTKIREKILKTLNKESVSEKAKSSILKMLDDMVKNLIEGQCNWKSMRTDKTEEPHSIASKWNEGWKNIKNIFGFLTSNLRRNSEIPMYIDNLQKLFRSVSKDAEFVSKKYKLQCEFVPRVSYVTTDSNGLRINSDKTDLEEDGCQKTIVCSNELRDFMLKFYQSLNDTAVSVFRNYEEMYIREVNADDAKEKELIVSILSNVSKEVEGAVRHIYSKETKKFKLDEKKNQQANFKFISNFIKHNINNVKDKVRKILKAKLVNIGEKIIKVIRDDIDVNLEVDLGNLEQEFIKLICTEFRLCNGKFAGRRQNEVLGVDKNNILVQVQLSFDDDLNGYRRFFHLGSHNTTVTPYSAVVNITRTTLFNSTM